MNQREVIDVDAVTAIDHTGQGPPTIDLSLDDDDPTENPGQYRRSGHPQTGQMYQTQVTNAPKRKRSPHPSSSKRARQRIASGTVEHRMPLDSHASPRRPKCEPTNIIILDCDTSEDEVEEHLSPVLKKSRWCPDNDDDELADGSDDDYDRFLVGITDKEIWKPLRDRKPLLHDEPEVPTEKSGIANRRGRGQPLVTRWQDVRPIIPSTSKSFNTLKPAFRTRNEFASLPNVIPISHRHHTVPKSFQSMKLPCTSSFKQSPGSIMRVIQQKDWVVVCSTCFDGFPDSPDDGPLSVWNREGSLIVWHDGIDDIMTGHRQPITDSEAEAKFKHYSVNDIKFDPTSTSFVSSGNDKKVRSWQREPDSDEYVQGRIEAVSRAYTHVPNEIAFKPGTNRLAVAEKKMHIYPDYEYSTANKALCFIPPSEEHTVGSMLWGWGASDGYIFASSEPDDNQCFEGFHQAIDVESGESYALDSDEAGDTLALTLNGDILVHTSRGTGGKHPLRLYDVRRQNGRPIKTVQLENFRPDIAGEVNSISISPDGIYIAIARIDNRVHVYDTRMLSESKQFEYEHRGPSLTPPGQPSPGVVEVQWVETEFSRLTLVSGGIDGCIRLWDPLQAVTCPTNGIILAQVNSDIGHFNVGDCTEREQQLVVGDCSGEVNVFNGSRIHIRPL